MRYRFSFPVIALLFSLILASCASGPPISGIIYTNVKQPYFDILGKAQLTDTDRTKVGQTVCHTYVFWLVATGDCSIGTAMDNGGLKKVQNVDVHVVDYLGLYGTYTLTVFGE